MDFKCSGKPLESLKSVEYSKPSLNIIDRFCDFKQNDAV